MSQGLWTVSNFPATATAASASQVAVGGTGVVNRARNVCFSVATGATASGPIQCVVRDGDPGTGTIIWQGVIGAAIGGGDCIPLNNCDLRASQGNALTAETVTGGAATSQISISMSGDLVQIGKPGWFA